MAISSPIVSLVPGATEIVCALGCEHRLVGVSHQCDFPPSVSRLPKLTRSRIDSRQSPAQIDRQVKELLQSKQSLYEIDLEKLSELQPEIVLTQVVCEVCAISPKDVQVALQSDPRLASASIGVSLP